MKIEVKPIKQSNATMYLGVIAAKDLFGKFVVQTDEQSQKNKEGYQRTLSDSRALAFLNFVEKVESAISPTSVLLNYREELKVIKEGEKTFLNIPDKSTLWVVDGQHRLRGLERGVSENNVKIVDFEIPFVIMNERDIYLEALQFYIINKTQKGVKSDLAQTFLIRIRNRNPDFLKLNLPKQVIKNIEWNPEALKVMFYLNNDKESPWYKKIQLPNEAKQRTVIPQVSFIDSLDPIFKDDIFQKAVKYNEKTIAELLKRYWQSIKELCPEAFEDPKEYVIQKTPGIFTLHKVFIKVINLTKQSDKKISVKSLKKILEQVPEVFKSKFWESEGDAGRYGTNKKAFGLLYRDIMEQFDKAKFKIDVDTIEL